MQIEEAIKEIEYAKSFGTSGVVPRWKAIDTVLNELEKKDKVIDEMVKEIACLNYEFIGVWCKQDKCENFKGDEYCIRKCDTNNENCIKKYFYKRESENNMMPLESSIKGQELYCRRVLKWYEKIWYFLTGKKNKAQKLGKIEYIGVDEEW